MSWAQTIFLKRYISEQRTLGASDVTLKVLLNDHKDISSSETELGNFTPLTSGAIRIKFKFNGLDSRPGVHAIIEGDESFTGYYKIQNTHTEEEYNMDISVKKGVKYTIKAKTTNVSGARCVSCNICGTFAPSNLIE